LESTLSASAAALDLWLDAQADVAAVMAADPRVRDAVLAQLALARRTAGDPGALRASPALATLRTVLAPVLTRDGETGFFVVDTGGLIVARIVDGRIGERVVLDVAEAANRALGGRPVFLPPTTKQRFAAEPMAFVLVVVKDGAGAPVAVLALRIPASRTAEAMRAAPLGATGDTYALDGQGRTVSNVRFGEQVAGLGLLPPDVPSTIAVLEVRDPPSSSAPESRCPGPAVRGPSPGPRPRWPPGGPASTWTVIAIIAGSRWWAPGAGSRNGTSVS
jgi:hypothetical protein